MNAHEFLQRVEGVQKEGDGWKARCPAHDDTDPSLGISNGDKGVVLTCRVGCATEAVVAALGLQMSDLFYEKTGRAASRRIERTYDYMSATGELLYQVVRFEPKDFRQRRPDGRGGWEWSLNGTERVLYRLPDLVQVHESGGVVWLVEGEKDADALQPLLEPLGCCATTMPGGVGKWRDTYTSTLAGGSVIIVADQDEPGLHHAADVAARLRAAKCHVDVVQPAAGKDAADHVQAGFGVADFVQLPEVAQVADPPPAGVSGQLSNSATPYKGCGVVAAVHTRHVQTQQPVADPVADSAFAVSLTEFINRPRDVVAALLLDHDDRPVIAKNSLTMLGARGGRGKTTWFIDLMVHLALGRDYLCFRVPAPVRILMIENEGPAEMFAEKLEERIKQLPAADAALVGERVHVHTLDWGGFNLGDESQLERLLAFLAAEPKDLIFGDPLDSLGIEGVGSPEDTRRFLGLMKAAGLNKSNAWWLNTHPRKEETKEAIDEIAGAWGGKPDTIMLLDMLADDRSRVRFPKVRWARRGKRESILLAYDADTETFSYIGADGGGEERNYIDEIVALLADGKWHTVKEIAVAKEGGIGAAEKTVKRLLETHPDLFDWRSGEDARAVGRLASSTVWQLSTDVGGES